VRAAYLRAEIVDRLMTDDGEPQPEVYTLLLETLAQLDNSGATPIAELGYKLKLADRLGYRPELNACVVCDASSGTEEYYLSPARGGIVNQACASPGDHRMSQNQVKLWRLLLVSTVDREIGVEPGMADDGLALCNQFYDYVFGRTFKSAQVLAT
jgi:DNA repair protein RecO (recombination protein O)